MTNNIMTKQMDLSILHAASEHDNGGDLIVPHHLPEPSHSQPGWTYPRERERERSRGGEEKRNVRVRKSFTSETVSPWDAM